MRYTAGQALWMSAFWAVVLVAIPTVAYWLSGGPMNPGWVIEIRDQCRASGVPFFFKQWGGVNKKKTGRLLDGRIYDEIPRPVSSVAARYVAAGNIVQGTS